MAFMRLLSSRMGVLCIALFALFAIAFLAGHMVFARKNAPLSAALAERSSTANPADPTISTKTAAASPSNESYQIDPANNQWAYNSPDLSVDIKKLHDDALKIWYYVADIHVKNPQAISSGLSDEVNPSANRAVPSDIALKDKAVFAINGDLFVARHTGIIIRNGKLWRNVPHEPVLAFYTNADMKVFSPTEMTARQLLDAGVANTFAFGPILIRDGSIDHTELKKNALRPQNPRTGVGLVEKNHFICVLVEGRQPGYSEGITLDDFAMLFQRLGCTTAYNLDGGQSSVMMFMGQALNSHASDMNGTKWNTYRHVSEILIFGKSQLIPVNQDVTGTSQN